MIKRRNDFTDEVYEPVREAKPTSAKKVDQRAEIRRLDEGVAAPIKATAEQYKLGLIELGAITKQSALYGGIPATSDAFDILGAPAGSSFTSLTGLTHTGHLGISDLRTLRNQIFNISVTPFREQTPRADTNEYAKLMADFNQRAGQKVYQMLPMRHDNDKRIRFPNMVTDERLVPLVQRQMLNYYETQEDETPPLNNNFQKWGAKIQDFKLDEIGSVVCRNFTYPEFNNRFTIRKQANEFVLMVAGEVIVQGEETREGKLVTPQMSDAAVFARKLQMVANMTYSGNGSPSALVERTGVVIQHSLEYRAGYIHKPDAKVGFTDQHLFDFWLKNSPLTSYYDILKGPSGKMGVTTIKNYATRITELCREAGIKSPFVLNINSSAGPPYPEADAVKKLHVAMSFITSSDELLKALSSVEKVDASWRFLCLKYVKAKDEPMTRQESGLLPGHYGKRRAIYLEGMVSVAAAIMVRLAFTNAPNFVTYVGPEEGRPCTLKGLNLSDGGAVKLFTTAMKHLLETGKKELLLTFADNLYCFEVVEVNGVEELHWWSLDGVKWESAANPDTYRKFMRYIMRMLDHELPADSNNIPTGDIPTDPEFSALKAGWAQYLLNLYPGVACEPVLVFGQIQVPCYLLSSGSAGTLEFNDCNMQRLIAIYSHIKKEGERFISPTGEFTPVALEAMRIACAKVQVESVVDGKPVPTRICTFARRSPVTEKFKPLSLNDMLLSFGETLLTAPGGVLRIDLLGHDLISVAKMTDFYLDAVAQLREGKLLVATANTSNRDKDDDTNEAKIAQYFLALVKAKSLYLTSFARPGADVFFERAVALFSQKLRNIPGGTKTAEVLMRTIPDNLEGVLDDDVVAANVDSLTSTDLPSVYEALLIMGGKEMALRFVAFILQEYTRTKENSFKRAPAFRRSASDVWRLIPPWVLLPLAKEDSRVPPPPEWVLTSSKYEEWNKIQSAPEFFFSSLIGEETAPRGPYSDAALRNVRRGAPGEPLSRLDAEDPTMAGVHPTNVESVWADLTPRQKETSLARAKQVINRLDALLKMRDPDERSIALKPIGDMTLGQLTGRFITRAARGMGLPVKALRLAQKGFFATVPFVVSPARGISEDTAFRALIDLFPRDSILPVAPKDKLPGHPDRKVMTFAKVASKTAPKDPSARRTAVEQHVDRKSARAERVERAKAKKLSNQQPDDAPSGPSAVDLERAGQKVRTDVRKVLEKRLQDLLRSLRDTDTKLAVVTEEVAQSEQAGRPANQARAEVDRLTKKRTALVADINRVSHQRDNPTKELELLVREVAKEERGKGGATEARETVAYE